MTAAASFEYMKNEGERLLLEALDELEVAHTHEHASRYRIHTLLHGKFDVLILKKVIPNICNTISPK